jgi:cysteine desulfurase family protein
MIYVDNGATSYFKPPQVIEKITEYLKNPGNPDRGVHENAMNASRIVLETRMKIAQFFDCDHFENVIFTSGITESLNIVIQGLFHQGDHIITTYLEHNSVLRPLYKQQVDLSITDGSIEEIEKAIQPYTKAVIVTHASNVTGEILDIKEIGKLCQKYHILFIVDSAQSAGVLNISMKDGIDILCFTGHKGLLGIQGIGGLCINNDIKIPSFKVGGSGIHSFDKIHPTNYPTALEAGTLNVPGIVSLNASLDYLNERGIDDIYKHEKDLADLFLSKLDKEHIIVYRNAHREHVGIVSLNIKGMDASKVCDKLSYQYGIETRGGAHCAPLVHNHYHTDSMIRFSFGINNTVDDVLKCVQALNEMIEE